MNFRPIFWGSLVFFLSLCLCPYSAHANDLAISSVSLVDCNTTAKTINVQFTVTWDNAWKDEINNDAVWIFIKYSKDAGTTWYHATITSASYTPTGASISIPADQKGAFIQPANYGTGRQTYTAVELQWAYGLDGVSDAEVIHATNSKVKVFGIEMVYIPAGGFYAGDTAQIGAFKQGSSDTKPWFIPNENAIHVTNIASGGYYYTTDSSAYDDASGADFWIPQDFPKGYKAIYMMKYEISEGQWVAFFNTLTAAQKTTRDITSATGKNSDSTVYRNTVAWTSGDATTTRSARACSYLSWADGAAYAGWAGLRPMTELEFEKAARGPLAAVSGEYAWGTTSITACSAVDAAESGGAEKCSTASANCTYSSQTIGGSGDGGTGPTRVGIYATSATATARGSAGAGFYGNLDLSGNLWERPVTVGNAAGRAFVGSHGDGVLSTNGNATNPDWPGYSAGEVTAATGSGIRGGAWDNDTTYNRVSERTNADVENMARYSNTGGRCVRMAE